MQIKQDFEKCRKDFIFWSGDFLGSSIEDNREEILLRALSGIGIRVESIFIESDTQKLRLYLLELILQRHHCEIDGSREYISAVGFLLSYLEFLERKTDDFQNVKITNDKTKDSLTVAYYLSRANKVGVELLDFKNFTDAFSAIASILGQKATTIKNMRDEFDPYFDNGRKGWYQRELSISRKIVFNEYENVSIDNLTIIVKGILSKYSSANISSKSNESNKKTIRIKNNRMKVIKQKK